MNIRSTIHKYPVTSFVIATLGLSFAVFLIPVPPESAFTTVATIAVLIPTIVAFALAVILQGRSGAGTFFRQTFAWRSPWKWYLIALGIGFLVHFGSSLLALLTGQIAAIEIAAPSVMLIALFPFALLEEIGWRGFALWHLLERRSLLTASLMIGIPWALLHFVLFAMFVPEGSPLAEALVVLAFAFLLNWSFVRSGRKVLVSTTLHGALNAFAIVGAAIPPAEVLWFVLASACLIVAAVTLLDRRIWFAGPEKTAERQAVRRTA
jgi:membrane protease YdiL (CAAX protease family)